MEVQIISKEFIKPSSPTPEHLKIHKLSFMEQMYHTIYTPMIFYYPSPNNSINQSPHLDSTISQKLHLLKQSLSHTLTNFYPLAGRIKDNLTIDCNDEGVSYTEARVVDSNLLEFLANPNISELSKFLPDSIPGPGPGPDSFIGAPLAFIRVSVFSCGGLVICVYISHTIADGRSICSFFNGWAANTINANGNKIVPSFDGPSMFPQNESFPSELSLLSTYGRFLRTGRCGSRRFFLSAKAITELKAKVASSGVTNPTRVEVVSALFWKSINAAMSANSGGLKLPLLMTHQVNLRKRANPPFSEYFMGNFTIAGGAICRPAAEELSTLVRLMRESIAQFNGDFVKSLQSEGGFDKYIEVLKEMDETIAKRAICEEGLGFVGFTSWCNFGLYDGDFGWGKPKWVTSSGYVYSSFFFNMIGFLDTASRDAIEAWVTLDEDELLLMDKDEAFMSYVIVNPSPLSI